MAALAWPKQAINPYVNLIVNIYDNNGLLALNCKIFYNVYMKRLLFLLFIIVTGCIVFFTPPLRLLADKALQSSACNTPVAYKIGTIDERFGLSQTAVAADIEQATSLWSQAEGKTLFANDANALLTVNFVYDQRQALTSQIQTMQQSLDAKNSNLQAQIQLYYGDVNAFKQKLRDFNTEVDGWNTKGGAPPDVYAALTQKQKDLQNEGEKLNNRAKELNLSTTAYNTDVNVLNQDVQQFNRALAQKPEEGLYNPADNTITMYFASDRNELIHTLAHEFGHALGINHVEDEDAIMYPYTTKKISLAQEDITQLQYVCRPQYVFVLWAKDASLWLNRELIKLENKN